MSLQYPGLSSYQSFRGSIINGGRTLTPKTLVLPSIQSDPEETPPKVPPRKESISPLPVKPELPVHLISTTNQDYKPAPVQQKIPTKLATLSKGKEKVKTKGSHQRTHSAGQDTDLLTLDLHFSIHQFRVRVKSQPNFCISW